ncbi:MAG: DNA primase [Clostridium sp.]|uniref:DNA primase n=1 Tax=Clostridium sp. TaxID=1506 RepID=UPI00290A1C7A|nr:DNA primase [Clostridium sp.]MDU7336565.1 DNA primase [Clostridium sp.]
MALSDDFLQELKSRSDITDVVSSYIDLRHSGRTYSGLCPFHSEKSPSFHVYPENGSFYCFGCGAGGDVITFVRRIENLDYMESIRLLAQRAGMTVPENEADQGLAKAKGRILEINRETARFYHTQLLGTPGTPGREYLLGRGLTPQTIRHFGLGYAPDSRFALVNTLSAKGYTPEELLQANVAVRASTGRVIDRFFARVMYPIIDLRGNVIAFGGRTLGDYKPKYLNTSDTLVFHKSTGLFAMNFAKNNAKDGLILAEGYMDVIALHQAGFENAIATLGTALTTEQARLLARYTGEVYLCYDSDEAGQKASSRAIPILRNVGLTVRVLNLSAGKDPDEFIRSYGEQGPARFRQLIESSGNDVEYRLQKLRAKHNVQTTDGKVAYLTSAAELLSTLDSRMEQEIYAGRLAEEIGIERASILQQVEKNSKKRRKDKERQEFRAFQQQTAGIRDTVNPEKSQNLRAANAEEALIVYLMQHPDAASALEAALPPENFVTSFNRRLYTVILGKIKDGKACGLTDLAGEFSVEEISSVAKMLADYHQVHVTAQDAKEYRNVILQEKQKLDPQKAAPQDIRDYLQRLREQKK